MSKYEVQGIPVIFQPTKKDCWLTCATMIMGDRVKRMAWGPTEPLFRAFGDPPHGIRDDEMIVTLEKMGMTPFVTGTYAKSAPMQWTTTKLEYLLKQHGALWCSGKWKGHRHVVVVVGLDVGSNGNTVIIHDPAPGRGRQAIDFQEFSESVRLVAYKKTG